MNLNESLFMETLLSSNKQEVKRRTLPASEMVREVFRIAASESRQMDDTKNGWKERNLTSKKFFLCEVLLNRVANPSNVLNQKRVETILSSSISEQHPIVIDFNKNGLGKIKRLDYKPHAVVIDGREKFVAASLRGETRTIAWVGSKVFKSVHACSATCGCKMEAEKKTQSCEIKSCSMKFTKSGKTITIKDIHNLYNDLGASTHRSRIAGVAPPGYEGTLKHMKKHKDIPNPYALSWWMYNKGYRSHVKEPKK